MTLEKVIEMMDSSPFCVWKSSDGRTSLFSLPNGLEVRIEDKIYRIGSGYGPGEDGYYPMMRCDVLRNGFREMVPK